MTTTMTVTELVRDTCREAASRTARGETILVKSGHRPLFKLVPVQDTRRELSPRELVSLERELRILEGNRANNPVLKLRKRRA